MAVDEDLRRIVKLQSGVEDDSVVDRALDENNGDAVNAICDLLGISEGDGKRVAKTSRMSASAADLKEFREILNEKSAIFYDYMENQKQKQLAEQQADEAAFMEHMNRREAEIKRSNEPPTLPDDADLNTYVEEAETASKERNKLPDDDALLGKLMSLGL